MKLQLPLNEKIHLVVTDQFASSLVSFRRPPRSARRPVGHDRQVARSRIPRFTCITPKTNFDLFSLPRYLSQYFQ